VRDAACLFDLIHDPVPVAHGFKSDRRCFWEPRQKGPDGAGLVVDPGPLDGLAPVVKDGEGRIVLAQP